MKRRAVLRIASSLGGIAVASAYLRPTPAAAQVADHLGVPGPIAFDGEDYILAWSRRTSAERIRQEYVPTGQSIKRYERMLLVERLGHASTAMELARVRMAELDQREAADPLYSSRLIEHRERGEALLDFVVSTSVEDDDVVVEWNAHRYAPAPAGQPGVVLFGLSHRAYGTEGARAFLATLRSIRPLRVRALAEAAMPAVR